MSTLTAITERNFAEEIFGGELAVIVHFHMARCPACRRVAAALQVLATEFPFTVKLATVDVSCCHSLVTRFGVVVVPTLIVFVQGVERLRLRGALRLDELGSAIRDVLAATTPPPELETQR